jgi:hypothetical protein
MREYFMETWHRELKSLNADYVVISGHKEERLRNAIGEIDLRFREELVRAEAQRRSDRKE